VGSKGSPLRHSKDARLSEFKTAYKRLASELLKQLMEEKGIKENSFSTEVQISLIEKNKL
jgi:hypothetical protein